MGALELLILARLTNYVLEHRLLTGKTKPTNQMAGGAWESEACPPPPAAFAILKTTQEEG